MSAKGISFTLVVIITNFGFAATTYDLASGNVSVPANATAIITQANLSTKQVRKITIGNGATVTLQGINMIQDGQGPLIKCNGNATVILADGTVNTLDKTTGVRYDEYPFQIAGSSNTTVVIKGGTAGTGKLIVRSPSSYIPGIGGYGSGNLRIEGGVLNITAGGDNHVSAIGPPHSYSGHSTPMGNITITGGTITATGGYSGIGPAYDNSCGAITISGGVVNASGYCRGGIESQKVIISGGIVNATNRYDKAGIQAGTLRITEGITKIVAGSKSGTPIVANQMEISSVLMDVTSSNGKVRTLTCPTYTITWKNYDGTTLKTNTGVRYGAIPSYSGSTPIKPSTAQYSYTFKGWSPTVVAATANKTYTAAFTETVRKYTVTWKDEGGSTLKTESIAYGTMPDYGDPPTKASSGVVTYAFAGWVPDIVAVSGAAIYTATYVRLNPEAPVITPESGTTFDSSLTVSMTCPTEGANIYYTTNGIDPTVESSAYKRFRITGKRTVKAIAEKDGLLSEVATAEYALGRCGDPVMSVVDGTEFAHANQLVSIWWDGGNDVGVLRYTLDGGDPTAESPIYEGPISISDSTVIKAKVFSDSYFDSNITTASLVRVWENVATPVIDAPASFAGSKAKVVISCTTEGAVIRYTLNGSEPNSHSAKYTGPIYVTDSCTVKAYAVKTDYLNSAVATQAIEKVWGIGDALGKPDHSFTTDGDGGAGWVEVDDATAPNGKAMKSGAIGNSQNSVLGTKIIGPGTLTFSWRTSCEEDPDSLYEWDHVEFSVDGAVLLRRDGINSWKEETVAITSDGEHTVIWTYKKDDVEADGEDAAYVAGYGWVTDYTETQTTEVSIPYAWLLQHDPEIVDEFDAYEAAAKVETGKKDYAGNSLQVWQDYVVGTDPTNPASRFMAKIEMVDGAPVVTWEPDLNTNGIIRTYKVYGKEKLEGGDEWQCPTNSLHRFFKVAVEMP